MKRFVPIFVLFALLALFALPTPPVQAAGPQWVVVNWGDTLSNIAARYGTTPSALADANRLPGQNFVYIGQRLIIPASAAPAANAIPVTGSMVYVVRAGDTATSIAARYNITLDNLRRANGSYNLNIVYTGQRIVIPAVSSNVPPSAPPGSSVDPAPMPPNSPYAGRWIDVNIKKQTITAYDGRTAVKTVKVSTGISIFPTPAGSFKVYRKYPAQLMTGGSRAAGTYYYLPNVPSVMYFYKSYAIHGTYWHHNFGRPMSHGCVNLTIADAKWFYNWAPMGTQVITHY